MINCTMIPEKDICNFYTFRDIKFIRDHRILDILVLIVELSGLLEKKTNVGVTALCNKIYLKTILDITYVNDLYRQIQPFTYLLF